jgi:hypothetical protein
MRHFDEAYEYRSVHVLVAAASADQGIQIQSSTNALLLLRLVYQGTKANR